MNVASPHFLWLLAVPLLLLLFVRRRPRRPAAAAGSHPNILPVGATHDHVELARPVAGPARGPRRPWRFWLAFGLAVAAVAGPQWGEVEDSVIDQSREILIALDLSRSMLADDVRPTRLERARLMIASMLEQLRGERVGLVVFSGTAFVQLPLSSDYEILREFLPELGPDYLPEEGTDFDAMLAAALSAYGTSATDRFLIVMSDGEAQANDWRARMPALVAEGIRVVGLGFGTTVGAGVPDAGGKALTDPQGRTVVSKLDRRTLEELARQTGGVYRDASRWVDVAALLDASLDRERAGEVVRRTGTRLGDRFQWFLAPAILLLAWSCWREFALQPRPRTYRFHLPGPSQAAAAGAAALAALLAVLPHVSTRAQEITATARAMESLTEVVRRVSARPDPGALDYAELGFAVVANGARIRLAQEPVPPGILRDGLAAIAAGRALDPKAVDWDRLQADVLQLAKLPSAQRDGDNSEPPTEAPSATDETPPEGATPGEGEPADPGAEGPDDEAMSESGEGQQAFGDPQEGEDNEGTGPGDPSAQEVGGKRQRDYAALRDTSLLVPLHKLDELRRADSPGELYQLMQERPADPAPKTQRW